MLNRVTPVRPIVEDTNDDTRASNTMWSGLTFPLLFCTVTTASLVAPEARLVNPRNAPTPALDKALYPKYPSNYGEWEPEPTDPPLPRIVTNRQVSNEDETRSTTWLAASIQISLGPWRPFVLTQKLPKRDSATPFPMGQFAGKIIHTERSPRS
jgi:hypothetical protein